MAPMPRTDTASRLLAAPPEHVFGAFVHEDALTARLPPVGMHGHFERFDARPGGSYRMILAYDEPLTARGKTAADSDIRARERCCAGSSWAANVWSGSAQPCQALRNGPKKAA
jgi:hypothetical protein